MHAFVPVRGRLVSRLEEVERRIIARLVADTAELLGTQLESRAGAGVDATGEDHILASLDFEPAEESAPDAPADAALARLLPPMSHDEELAAELRGLTESSLRAAKVERLDTVWRALAADRDAVVVHEGTEDQWLSALTDVRLVLASRLHIENEADAEAVYRRAQRPRSGRPEEASGGEGTGGTEEPGSGERDEVEEAMATMYAALTWWQESLLQAMTRRGRGRGR
ncbi:hypothetical protein GCM10023169_41850 [Georgenia halophila]|uniref:DUF2017 family protein n=1 Tax=Georgenia halophila TaxID=620889 RepID=A0ABP8LQU2_9MICO